MREDPSSAQHSQGSQQQQRLVLSLWFLSDQSIPSTGSDPAPDMSDVGMQRWIQLCCVGYQADVVFPKALERLHVDCRREMDLWKERLEQEKEERLESIQELQEQIQRLQREMRRMTKTFTTTQTQLQSKIQWLRQRRRHELEDDDEFVLPTHDEAALRDTDLEFVDVVVTSSSSSSSSSSSTSETKEDVGSSLAPSILQVDIVVVVEETLESNHPTPISSSSQSPNHAKFGDSMEWIDIVDDDYFHARSAEEERSDWVLCAL
jgi:TolA-binding protein